MRGEHANWFAGLDEECFIVTEHREARADGVERLPASHRAAGTPVHHEILRAFRHFRVEIVHEHAERCFLDPATARNRGTARRTHHPGCHTNAFSATSAATFSMSGVRGRSTVSGGTSSRTRS